MPLDRRRIKRSLPLAALLALLAYAPRAAADSDSDQFTVTATVIASCSVTANDLDFGDYDPVSATPLDSASTISVTCTNGTAYDVAMDEGVGSGATAAARKMADGANLLTYALYRDAARANVWGDTGGADTLSGTGTGAAQVIDVYGRAPAGQTAPAGDYDDTITVTVSY